MNAPKQPAASSPKKLRLGEYLIKSGIIDEDTLAKALDLQKQQKKRLGRILVDMGAADEVAIAKTLAIQLKIPYGRLNDVKISKEVISLVPAELAENHLVIPLKKKGQSLLVGMANPLDLFAMDDLRFFTQMPIDVAVVPEGDILDAIQRHYPKEDLNRGLDMGSDLDENIEIIRERDPDEKEAHELLVLTELPPIVRFTNSVLADAIKLKASDVHIEPQNKSIIIRYRVDGIMREIMRADKQIHAGVVSRIKIISNLDISIKRKPQDGKAQVKYGDKVFDLRVSTLPTSYGEKVTIRILNPATAEMNPEDLGFSTEDLKHVLGAISKPQGIILVTGPTGSGKSSTLYACLNKLNSSEVNIVTVEDPVEFDVSGINQVQINPAAGITFATGLRSILRQDPDIVMVGEIRDGETAVTAFQAAQTGHLVLSTLHTNDAPSAVIRLMDLGIDPFLVSASLIAIVGQRLVRGICQECKTPDTLLPEQMELIRPYIKHDPKATFWKGAGCEACQFTGYSGRMGLFEILMITTNLKRVISPNIPVVQLKQEAEKEGFRAMAVDGIMKALQGRTTMDEVFRVAPPEAKGSSHAQAFEPDIDQYPTQEETTYEDHQDMEISATVRSISPKKILIVDDNVVILKLLCHLLESEGYLVVTAKDGLEALKMASMEKPDLIITDFLMPNMDGVTLIRKLKSQMATRFIPIIMLTAKNEVESEIEVIDAGADDYLTKPVVPKRLLARTGRLLKR